MVVNGKEVSISELSKPTIHELLNKYNIKNTMIAIEINGNIIEKSEWDKEILKDSDVIEIIRFVGGG